MSSDLRRRLEALERAGKIGVVVVDSTGLPPWTRDVWPPWRRSAEPDYDRGGAGGDDARSASG
jgi:hypothetical protein